MGEETIKFVIIAVTVALIIFVPSCFKYQKKKYVERDIFDIFNYTDFSKIVISSCFNSYNL